MKTAAISLLALLALGACETIIDVPEPEHTPALAVRYSLGTMPAPDDATRNLLAGRQLYVSASQRLFDTQPLKGLATATARLYDDNAGGALVEEFVAGASYATYGLQEDGYYVPTLNFQPQPGRAYRLRVEAPGYAAVESRLTLPPAAPTITSAAFTPALDSDPYGRRGRLTVNVQDDPNATDYYVAFARLLDANGQPLGNNGYGYGYISEEEDDDGVSTLQGDRLHLSNAYDNYLLLPYADTDINGRAFALSVDVRVSAYDPNGGPMTGGQIEVVISRVTRDSYLFWLSLDRYRNSDGNPFAEPAPLYSNVGNGFGIFGGSVDATVRVPLP